MTDISGGMPKLDFRLTRADGAPVSGPSYRGKVVALYFGYTHCPDVCPTTLANLTDMLGRVKSPDVRVLFVTVDPARDTLAVLADYAKAFSPQVEGLARHDIQQLAELGPHLSRRLYGGQRTALYGDAFQCGVLFRSRWPGAAGHHRHHQHCGRDGRRCDTIIAHC